MEPSSAPGPPASAEPPTPPADSPRRPWTILGRLSKAVHEQNWFAVVLELTIVVLGVVIGFQVTAWGQARSDTTKEQTYLRQLAEDLDETVQLMVAADRDNAPGHRAVGRMHRAFYTPERPPADSLLAWVQGVYSIREVRPIVGTAEALVATGDLSLVRSDSLRSAITTYLEDSHLMVERLSYNSEVLNEATRQLHGFIDPAPIVKDAFPPEAMASVLGVSGDDTAFFEGERRTPFPFDAEQFLSNRNANVTATTLFGAVTNLWRTRGRVRSNAAALRIQVEAELDW